MGIFAAAALAGFLLFGWIKATPQARDFFLKPRVQGVLGVLALGVVAVSVVVQTFQWPEYWVALIVQRLTGTEAAQFILGAVFGCILRYWGPHFWTMRMRPGTRYNWVAISLAGLLLLAAAVPYIGSLMRDWGVTSLKTPFAEVQFEDKEKAEPLLFEREFLIDTSKKGMAAFLDLEKKPQKKGMAAFLDLEKELQSKMLTNLEIIETLMFSRYHIETDLTYLKFFPEDQSAKHEKIYQDSKKFADNILFPLCRCVLLAHNNYLDTESIRRALIPVAQKLYLLIREGESFQRSKSRDSMRNVNLLRNKFLEQVGVSLQDLNGAFVNDRCKLSDDESLIDLVNPQVLARAPHIYLALAYLDAFNHNMDRTIILLESASERFSNHAPVVSFNINHSLALFLHEDGKHDRKNIFLYLDKALKITRKTISRMNQLKDTAPDFNKRSKDYVLQQFEFFEIYAKNFIAYVSAKEGVRKLEALLYAKDNYGLRNKLPRNYWPTVIDTYGYVKMAFEARKIFPNLDEIAEARALFKEAISHAEGLPDSDDKPLVIKVLRTHLKDATTLLTLLLQSSRGEPLSFLTTRDAPTEIN